MSPTVRVEQLGPVAVLTLNRPEVRNAVSTEMAEELERAVAQLDGAAAVVLAAEGSAFCAGLDLAEVRAGTMPSTRFIHELASLTAPIVVAVNGAAIAAGLDLVMACDVVVCSPEAVFVDGHARIGLPPPQRLIDVLRRRIGDAAALKMLLTSRPMDAAEALRVGLVNEVVDSSPRERAIELANEIASTNEVVRSAVMGAFRS